MRSLTTEITIVGAGLTGLTLAWYLKRAGKKVLLIDKNSRPGGVIETVREDGFVFEKGPNTGVIGTPEIFQLFEDLKTQVEVEVPDENGKKRWIWKAGKWHALPSGLNGLTTPLFTFKDKLRILGEPFRKPGANPDEVLSDMVVRRLGRSFLDYAVDPFISGIYAGDPNRLVTRYALPKLYNLEQKYGGFIKGALKKQKEPKTELEKRVTKEVFSIKGGLGNMVEALSELVGRENLFLRAGQLLVKPEEDGFECSFEMDNQSIAIRSQKVITTCSGKVLPALLPFIPDDLMHDASNAVYAKVVQVAMGYKKWDGVKLEAFGGLVPTKEKRNILGALFLSSLFKGRAPEGGALLSVFLGGIKKPEFFEKPDEVIKQMVLSEIEQILGSKQRPDLLRVFRYEQAIPQYEQTTGQRLEAVTRIQQQFPGLIIAGNLRDGIGMADRVKQGRQIANQIIQES